MSPTIYYVVDPMCSWCWGFAPVWREFVSEIPESVAVVDLMGGLAPDNEAPMDSAMRQYVQDAWGAVKARTGAEFNFEFWNKCEPKRSTYPACRAVIAAGEQASGARSLMYDAIQRAYFLEARNPSDAEALECVAGEIGLDRKQFTEDLGSDHINRIFQLELESVAKLGVSGFPTIVVKRESPGELARYDLLTAGFSDIDVLRDRLSRLLV
ncbi:MAG: DsbA family protein [Proteobacteria bacterium]|nr:DsbA family protein [Pseudomonadota bacterium]MBT4108271.1 DsbA family protein [Pseudomonadota bacterium]MBT6071567.1 DsbA family protein [Pseudomonadota bacterium]MBT6657723.1 DsbA family protein [Pseudomonadota bacterium]MBT7812036.1 DsbA family protein [Pseudomonadota bacterium]